ncbi:MAG: ribonuclease HII [Oscillospiraceae bacterium]
MDFWEIENGLFEKGYGVVAGVDEAGRGPLAGPVYAAAVILPGGLEIPGLDDSKKLSPAKRERLFDIITSSAVSYGIGTATHEEIDDINILNATYLAMNRAIANLHPMPNMCIIDGNRSNGICYQNICVVGGDGKSASVAAASVIAKVSRDRFMLEMAKEYPEYGFEKHKGYGTKLHYERLRQYGPSPIHRKTFLRKLH